MADTQIITLRYRIKDKAAKTLSRHAKACNYVWNYCVNAQKHAFQWRTRWPSAFDLIKLTTGCAADLGLHSDTVSAICRQFAESRNKIKKCPRYRGKKSLGWVPFIARAIRVSDDAIIYKTVSMKFWKSRDIIGKMKSGSFSQDARGRWYVNIVVERECIDYGADGEVGIDLGLKTLAVLSTGEEIANTRHFRKYEVALAVAQRAGNKTRAKAIHAKIANARKDFLHKQSTRLVRTYGRIVVGNVNSAKLAKTKMAKSVLDAGWSIFRKQLQYKAIGHCGEYVEIDERYSTQTCSSCGSMGSKTRPKGIAGLGIRTWECSDCGKVHDRDHNAALNILRFARERPRPVVEIPVL